MDFENELSRVRTLSNAELISGLNDVLRSSRRAVAQLVVHLGEVEERRLHLIGGYASLFAYCVSRLGMSEDEAYRRIEVGRLARCYPSLLPRLAAGRISLSVATLLKSHLTSANSAALLDAVSGKTVQQAREVLAAWYPSPDVLPSIRKLPSPQPSRCPSVPPAQTLAATDAPASPSAPTPSPSAHAPTLNSPTRSHLPARAIEPLSAERYKLQLTASAELKRKLELARDLLRHAIPNGDLATIIERALDALLQQTLKQRFAVTSRPRSSAPSNTKHRKARAPTPSSATHLKAQGAPATPTPTSTTSTSTTPATAPTGSPSSRPPNRTTRRPTTAAPQPSCDTPEPTPAPTRTICIPAGAPPATSMQPATRASSASSPTLIEPPTIDAPTRPPGEGSVPTAGSAPTEATPTVSMPTDASTPPAAAPILQDHQNRHIPSHVRRAVLDRDGARCTWQGPDGTRCENRAWLEHDHITPRGQGGAHHAFNIRLLCRPHNRLAAELAYGKDTVQRIIARQRAKRAERAPRRQAPSSDGPRGPELE